MCTVIYTPTKDGALFSSNRDEDPNRQAATAPTFKTGLSGTLLYPTDGAAGGTWIGVNNAGNLLILLNGGFDNHIKKETYKMSRGLIVKALLDSIDPIGLWNDTDLANIEPFTIVAYVKNTLHQLVWTGSIKVHLHPNSTEPHIWSSSTLYNYAARKQREELFKIFSRNNNVTKADLLFFLQKKWMNNRENSFVMDRGGRMKTCSISLVEFRGNNVYFNYHDLLTDKISCEEFALTKYDFASITYSHSVATPFIQTMNKGIITAKAEMI